VADYGVNIKVGVQGQSNAKQLGEQIREIVRGLEAADNAFTRFTNNLKSFDQRRAQRKINDELDKTAQKYRELDRLQRQLLANDNSAIKSAERRAKLEEFISKNISAGRMRRRAQFLRGDPAQYPSGANQPFAPDPMVAIRKLRDAETTANRQIFDIKQDLLRSLNNTEIDLLQEKIKREMDAQQEIFSNAIRLNKKAADDFDKRLARATRDRSEAARLTGQTSPIGGAVGIPGSPAALAAQERARRLQSARGSALIGGAFPLLFGQGLGAAGGGALGGFGGGMIGGEFGFGLSLVGTQIGTLIDQFAASAVELGQALNPLTVDIDVLTNAAGLAATETQKLIQQIEEEAGEKAALAAATSELALIVGLDGVDALREFGDGSLELSRQFSIAMTQMQSVLAKFLNSIGLGKGLAGAVEKTNLLRAGLANTTDPELLKLQKERRQALTGATGAVGGVATIGIDKEIVERQRELQKENSEELKKQAKLAAQNNDEGLRQAGILRDRLTIEELGGSLLNDRVYGLERSIIFQEAALKAANDELTPLEKANIFRERDVELLQLANKRQAEAERIANRKLRLSEREQRAIDRRVKAVERELERTDKAFDRASSQLDDIINKHEDKMAFEREYSRLIQEGSTPAAAKQAIELKKQLLELDRQYTKLLKAVDAQILKTEASIADLKAQTGVTTEYEKQVKALEDLKKKKEELEDKKSKAKGAIEKDLAPETGRDKIEAERDRVQGALNDLIDPANQVILAANAIGDAFSESFKGLITGSMSAQQALANLFQRTADHFADMAAEMIAHAIKMKVLGIALNFFGGAAASQGGSFAGVPNSTLDSVLPSTSSLADAAAATPLKLASGGYASGPTRALVGEGGQGEYIIPENRMRESMARYSRGARGAAVVPSSGASGTSGEGGGAAVAAPIDVRYTVERINSVDYVTADQFQRGMQQAAAQGATQGEQRALTTLRQNTSQRRRIGL
jgi:hypothetical protein